MTEQMTEKEITTLCEQARNDWLNFRNSVFDFLEKPETDPNSPQLIGLFTHNTRMNSTMLQLEEAFNIEPMIQASGISGTKQVSPEEPDAEDLGAEPKEAFDEHQDEGRVEPTSTTELA